MNIPTNIGSDKQTWSIQACTIFIALPFTTWDNPGQTAYQVPCKTEGRALPAHLSIFISLYCSPRWLCLATLASLQNPKHPTFFPESRPLQRIFPCWNALFLPFLIVGLAWSFRIQCKCHFFHQIIPDNPVARPHCYHIPLISFTAFTTIDTNLGFDLFSLFI